MRTTRLPFVLLPLLLLLSACGGGGGGSSGPVYSISGRITLNGEGYAGATVFLDGSAGRTAATDETGAFAFEGLPDGEYTVSPQVEGQSLRPAARAVVLEGASVAAADFVLVTYELGGSVVQGGQGCPGATVTLKQAGQGDRTVVTSWGGDYSFSGLLSGSYTLEVAVEGQAASPGFSNPVAVDGASRSGLDWRVEGHAVTGAVGLEGGAWTGGGIVILTGDDVRVAELDGAGAYAFGDLPNGSYSVRAYVPGQAVTPASVAVTVAGGDSQAAPFSLVTHALAGRVTDGAEGGRVGVTVTLAGAASRSVATGADGAFAFPGLVNGTYSVTPSLRGAAFSPASRTGLVVLDGDCRGSDFVLSYLLPGVATGAAADVNQWGATLRGTVNANGSATTSWFEWGTDPSLDFPYSTAQAYVGAGQTSAPVSVTLLYGSPGTVYYYRAVASNRGGTRRGEVASFATDPWGQATVVVNSLDDAATPPEGTVTLRSALEQVPWGGKIVFDPSLSGGAIDLTVVGAEHTVLKGETFSGMQFLEYAERDYGRSALYAAKDVTIDASALPAGITLRWAGGEDSRARVLAVYGNLTLRNVTVTGGHSSSAALSDGAQPYTLARGGGVAVWGTATLEGCTLGGNRVSGDENPSRDRGTFGGGLYANVALLTDCVISGNAATGYGAAGGGVYSVGGAETYVESRLTRCAVTGNRVTGQHAYGGGVYSDGGGPGNLAYLYLTNCTVARNRVEDHPTLPQSGQYYYRGGGIYLSNGYLSLTSCTVAENAVEGPTAVFSGKPNVGGGGVAATIGNAHVVEDMELRSSVLAGNTVNGAPGDVFTGSLLHFYSFGYNLVGALDFSQMLVPVPAWVSLSRRHWPQAGDREGVEASEALALDRVVRREDLRSQGTDAGQAAVVAYPPAGPSLDRVPQEPYELFTVGAGYDLTGEGPDDFLVRVLDKVSTDYADALGDDFGASFRTAFEATYGPLDSVVWYESPSTWPSDPQNAPWIAFWRDLDAALGDRLGDVRLGDDFWGTYASGPLGDGLILYLESWPWGPFEPAGSDQLGRPRPWGARGDVGAVEAEGAP